MAAHHPDHNDLIWPAQPSMSQLLASLKRTTLTIHNRLTSIRADAEFVATVAAAYDDNDNDDDADNHLEDDGHGETSVPQQQQDKQKPHHHRRRRHRCRRPLIANERCGSWYVPPPAKRASAYFKSTDGHERAWKFSTRRLNLHLVDLAEDNDGIIIVDSTRRGKRMPDALSTTIPIWCAVLNRVLLPDHPLSANLFLPPYFSASTHAQVAALLPSFVASFCALNLPSIPDTLTKPLRPLWVTQDARALPGPDAAPPDGGIFADYRPVICCTASRRVVGSEVDEAGYIQGAADDTENWALGLTAPIFWEHIDELVDAAEADLPGLIAQLVEQHKIGDSSSSTRKQLNRHISVCALPVNRASSANECVIALTTDTTSKDNWIKSSKYMEVGLGKSKTAARNLRLALGDICKFAAAFLSSTVEENSPSQIVIGCTSGQDLSIGTSLALLCYFFDDQDRLRMPSGEEHFTKALVKAKLGAVMTTFPEANPSRSTLQSVNSFLMDWRK